MLAPVARQLRRIAVPAVWPGAGRPCSCPGSQLSAVPQLRPRPRAALPDRPLLVQRRAASTCFTVKARPGEAAGEQTLFVVGLNGGKFFGQDGSEEALKLLERIVEQQGPKYNLLLSMPERDLKRVEDQHEVKNQKLSPSRDLEGAAYSEFVPIVQAGIIDKVGRRAVGRIIRTTQAHVAWLLWKNPGEARKVYWAFWQRNVHKNAAQREFWMKHFPTCAHAYFEEHAELCVIRTAELMAAAHKQGKDSTWVLVVSNEFYQPVTERLNLILDEDASEKLAGREFSRHLRDRATELCADVPDLTPLLVFIYLGFPVLFIQSVLLAIEKLYHLSGMNDAIFLKEFRD